MGNGQQQVWSGWGRWLSFAAAALLILLSIPLVMLNMAAAGWNIFLGLLLGAAVASGHPRAPSIAAVVSAVMAVRLVLAAVLAARSGAAAPDVAVGAGLLLLTGGAAYGLRRQAKRVQG